MVSGLACVVVDYGAPGTLINADRGLRVPIGPKAEMTQGFTRALEDLAAHPERIAPMGQAAADHVLKHYTWDAKARDIVEIYRWILKERKDRPVPGV
jgi:glycosyltransferase involved in cell wall biosynthesis